MDDGAVPMTNQAEYWFARRFPVGDRRNSFAPVHWKGWAASAVFVTVLTIGALAFAWMGAGGYLVQGVVVFATAAVVGGGWFIAVARTKGDNTRTVADYRKDRPRA
jgi:hypothetical protein